MKTSSADASLFGGVRKETSFDYLRENHFPEAVWNLGGAFRFDAQQLAFAKFMSTVMKGYIPLKQASGSPACLWTLDWFKPRALTRLSDFRDILEKYAVAGLGVSASFDNPHISEAHLKDAVGNTFVSEMLERDRIRLNSVTVASDKLGDHIRRHFPKLAVRAGVNRVVAEPGKRTSLLYGKLAEKYQRVAIHPADNTKFSLLEQLDDKSKYEITVNDTCLRACPVRKEHMKVLADIRENPYSAELLQQRHKFLQMAGCEAIEPKNPKQKLALLLTKKEMDILYDMGFRYFRIQSESFRNEISFIWDLCRVIFGHDPALSQKVGVITGAFFAGMAFQEYSLPSGLGPFSSVSYE